MDQNRIKRNQMLGAKIVKELTARNMEAYYTDSKEDALKKALELIPEGSSISWGGSMSVNEIGLKEAVCQGNYHVYNRDTALTPEDKRKIELAAYDCDYFLTSANAITEDGIMINIDGHSNRVSSIAAGPRNVLMIIGMNKVTRDVDSAMSRARNEAAPINAQRFPGKTPCCERGICGDCHADDCICSQIVITRGSMTPGRIKVILVGEALGF